MRREDEAFADEESSQCSSGCRSGWTLYLEHSGSGQQKCRTLPYVQPGDDVRRHMLPQEEYSDEEEEEDSMVSDASSGLPLHLLRRGEDDVLLHVRGQISMLSQQRPSASGGDQGYSSSGGGRRSASDSGSRSFIISTRSRSSGEMRTSNSKKRRAVVIRREDESATRRRRALDDDELHDTASSSGVIAPAVMAEEMYRGGDGMDLQPSCAFSAEHYSSLGWPAVRSTAMKGLAMLYHN